MRRVEAPIALLLLVVAAASVSASNADTCAIERVHGEVARIKNAKWVGGEIEVRDGDLHVAFIPAESPLAKAGVRVGDILMTVAGNDVNAMEVPQAGFSLQDLLPELNGDEPLVLELRRGEEAYEVTVMPALPEGSVLPDLLGLKLLRENKLLVGGEIVPEAPGGSSDDCLFEVGLEKLDELRRQVWLGIDELVLHGDDDGSELLIAKLDPDSPLVAAGIEEGDLILQAGPIDFSSMPFRRAKIARDQLFGGLRPGQRLTLEIQRGDALLEMEIDPPSLKSYRLASMLGARLLQMADVYFFTHSPASITKPTSKPPP